jgi:hypothetical protein
MKKETTRRGVLSGSPSVSFENLEARRLMSAALPTINVTARLAAASEANPTTTGMGQFMVTRSGSTAAALTVDYHLWSGDTAKPGVDFEAVTGVLRIAAGRSYGYVDIIPLGSKTAEPQRAVKIVLDSGGYQISKDSAQVLIAAYSPASTESVSASKPAVSVTARLAAASEINPTTTGMGQYMVTRSGSTAGALNVDYYLWSGDTAKSGVDFAPVTGVLKIAAGRSYGYVNIVPIATKTAEPQRSVKIVLESGSYTIGKQTAQVLIAAYSPAPVVVPPTVSIVASKSNASESDPTGTGAGTFTITRTGSTATALVVAYSIAGSSTAVAGTNYQPLSGSVTIAAGQSSATITLTPIDDGLVDADKTVSLSLTSSGNYKISTSQSSAAISIANADQAPENPDTISIAATQSDASELDPTGTGMGVYTVTRTGPDDRALTVNYQVDSASTAVAGTSFETLSGTVTFSAGQDSATINLVPIDDGVGDSGKTVVLDLTSSSNYTVNSSAAAASIIIANADIDSNPQTVTSASQLPVEEPANWFSYALPGYVNLATEPLYHAGGPSPDDVVQGYVGDCAFLAALSEVARLDPSAITNAIHQNTDGTYDVIFSNNLPAPIGGWPTYSGSTVDIHIDGWVGIENTVQQWSTLNYAQLGSGDATWVAIMEKAFAVYSSGAQNPSYKVANNGQWAGDCFGLFGASTDTSYSPNTTGLGTSYGETLVGLKNSGVTGMVEAMAADLAAGKAVAYGTKGSNVPGPLIPDHEYSVISVTTDNSGNQMITLRNPFGDANGDAAYSTVSAQIAWNQFGQIDSAVV